MPYKPARADNDRTRVRELAGCLGRLSQLAIVQSSKSSSQSADSSPEVTLGEFPAGTRLQIALKSGGALLIREFDNDVKNPWTTINGVRTTAAVVCQEALGNVRCKTSVVANRVVPAFEDVHEPPRMHAWRAAIVEPDKCFENSDHRPTTGLT